MSGWKMQPVKMQGEVLRESYGQSVRGDWVYYIVCSLDETAFTESWEVWRSRLTTGESEPVYAFSEGVFPNAFSVSRDGGLWFTEQTGGDPSRVTMRHVTAGGEPAEAPDLSGALEEGEYITGLLPADQGLWIVTVRTRVELRDGIKVSIDTSRCRLAEYTGKLICSLEVPEDSGVQACVLLGDGRSAFQIGGKLQIPDSEVGVWGEEIDLSVLGEGVTVYPSEGEYLFLAASDACLYGYRPGAGFQQLLDWEERGICWQHDPAVLMQRDGTLAAANAEERYIVRMIPCAPGEQVARVQLTLAGLWIDEDYRRAAVEFNKYNPAWQITVKDYAEGSLEDLEGAALRFNTELLSGRVPDILCPGTAVSTEALARNGALADLYPLLDGDPELSREDFLPEVLAAGEKDGKLYRIASGFELETLLADREAVGAADALTWGRLDEIVSRYPDRSLFTPDTPRETILGGYLTRFGASAAIDWQTGTCSFEALSYRRMLETAKTLPTAEELVTEQMKDPARSEGDPLAAGKALLQKVTLGNVEGYRRALTRLGDRTVFAGYPGDGGGVTYLVTNSSLAITGQCRDMEGAWAFLKQCLLDAASRRGFSSLRTEFENELAAGALEAVGPYGEPVLDRGTPLVPMTEADAAALRELIRRAVPAAYYDDGIAAVIEEEATKYFKEKCTAQQAAAAIQSRVSIYVAEQS